MDIPVTFFAAMALLFFILWVFAKLRCANKVDDATREHRIALSYIAWRRPSLIDSFVALHLAGDRAALDHYYPDFARYRLAEIEKEHADIRSDIGVAP